MSVVSRLAGDFDFIERALGEEKIGKGSFGVVYPGIRHPPDSRPADPNKPPKPHRRHWQERPVALKIFEPNRSDAAADSNPECTFLKEVETMAKVRHRACLRLYAWNFVNEFTIVTRKMEMDLGKFIREFPRKHYPEEARSIIALGVASGLAHLHSLGIVHCDIKPENILLGADLRPKIGDFGLARLISQRQPQHRGTRVYMAPERFENGSPQPPVDVYAYGMVLYELFTGAKLYPDLRFDEEIIAAVRGGARPQFPAGAALPVPLRQLIESCWAGNPANRPTFAEILEQRDVLKLVSGDYSKFDEYGEYLLYGKKGKPT
jgi:serine/threonine protein kinase